MNSNEIGLYEALSSTRAVRRLRPDPIPEAVLRRVLQASVYAPSGGNAQPWRMVAVQDAAAKQRIGELYRDNWRDYGAAARAMMERLPADKRGRGERILDASDYLAEHIDTAPVVLLFFHNVEMMNNPAERDVYPGVLLGASLYPAIQNLLLACRAEGLGAVLTTMLWRQADELAAIVDAPPPWRFHALVPVGYPVGKGHGPLNRKPLETMVFRNQWSQRYE